MLDTVQFSGSGQPRTETPRLFHLVDLYSERIYNIYSLLDVAYYSDVVMKEVHK